MQLAFLHFRQVVEEIEGAPENQKSAQAKGQWRN
jgi:hypothetical protein